MPRPTRNKLTPWIESLILSYSVPEEDEEEQQGGRSRGQLRAHVVGVNHMSESQAELQSSEDPTGLLFLSDGQLQIPAVLTAAAWERLQDQEDRECFTSLLNSTVCIQDYRLLFHMSSEETRCRFFLSVGQLATVAAGLVKDKPPCCSTLNSVRAKIRQTWRTLRGQEDSESQDGHELTVLLDEWQREVLEELKQDIRQKLNPQPSTSSHRASPAFTTGWDLDRVRYKDEEPFTVPIRFLLVPEDAAGWTGPSVGEALQQRSKPAAVEVWEDAKSSPPPTRRPSSNSPPPTKRPPSTSPPPTRRPPSNSPPPTRRPPSNSASPTRRPSSNSPPPTRRPSSNSPPPTRRPSSNSPPPTRRPSSNSPPPTRRPSSNSPPPTKRPSSNSPPPTKRPSSNSPPPVEDTTEKLSFSLSPPVEDMVQSEDIVLLEDMAEGSSFSPWDMFPPLCLSPSSSESSLEAFPPPIPHPADVHVSKESSFLPAYQKQPSGVVQTTASSSSVTPSDEAPTGQTLPAVEEPVEIKSMKVKRKKSDLSPGALSLLVQEELSSSPPSWLFDSQAGSQDSGSSSRTSTELTTAPVQRRTPSMHSDRSPFSYSYQVTGQNLQDLSRFRVAASLLQWSVKYLLHPDQTEKTQNAV